MKNFIKKLIAIYVNIYAFIDIPLLLFVSTLLPDKSKVIYLLYGLCIYEGYRYYKYVIKNYIHKKHFFGTVENNNVLAIYGGVGAGKTTLANYLLNKKFAACEQYHNYRNKGTKAFTHQHLFLKEKIEENSGVLIDEAGAMYDSFKYQKEHNDDRKNIVNYNKFFRQFYGDSLCIYVDQSESNLNTALYRTVYYVVMCKSCCSAPAPLIPYAINELFLYITNSIYRSNLKTKKIKELKKMNLSKEEFREKKKKEFARIRKQRKGFNLFSFRVFELMDFCRVGEYGEHYAINKDDKSLMVYLPAVSVFGYHNSRVFKEYNTAQEKKDYFWGADKDIDDSLMKKNFDFKEISKV